MLNRNDVEFSITIDPEEEGPEGWMEDDCAREVRENYESGNCWAWCQVTVHAKLEGFEGFAFLGGCSYESEEDFKSDLYYQDLCDEAYKDLLGSISETKTRLVQVSTLFK